MQRARGAIWAESKANAVAMRSERTENSWHRGKRLFLVIVLMVEFLMHGQEIKLYANMFTFKINLLFQTFSGENTLLLLLFYFFSQGPIMSGLLFPLRAQETALMRPKQSILLLLIYFLKHP